MDPVKITLSFEVVDDFFRNSRKCRAFIQCTTLILEIKHSTEVYIANKLEAGEAVSLQNGFNHTVNELIHPEDDDEWTNMF